ncbi:hypothetical protein LSH36_151g07062 [Paralvinella palmiformis]|uniref:Uncharacterized protein n=1 Tax=Paralvinella palmiformis TaxID=53620 RepID=A0AAD9JWE5_9ANNE|nr:hypothetical protein LSH36_151g07062 [Paralvinella palmiformis]
MGKKRSRGRSSAESGTSGDDDLPAAKHHKRAKKRSSPTSRGKEKPQKSSKEICEELGMQDVELEFSDADYQNLTTFSLFSRMVRPQLVAANTKASSAKMIQVMEAKWREYGKAKVATDRRRKEEAAQKQMEEILQKEAEMKGSVHDNEDSEDEAEQPAPIDDENGYSMDEDEEISVPVKKKSSKKSHKYNPMLRIKMPSIGVRKSSRDRKPVKNYLNEEASDSSASSGPTTKKQHNTESDSDAFDEFISRQRAKPKKKLPSQDEDSDSRSHCTKRGRKKKKEKTAAYSDADSDESDGEGRKRSHRKSKATKKKKKASSEDEAVSEKEVSNSEEDVTDSSENESHNKSSGNARKKKKPKVEKERPTIPGERKSERKRKVLANVVSDKEFERLMLEDAKEKEERMEAKRRRMAARKREEKHKAAMEEHKRQMELFAAKKREAQKEKGEVDEQTGDGEKKQDNEENDGNESDHYWFCEICKDGGDLLLCDTCPNSYHKECLKMADVPDGEWSCPVCTGEGLPEAGDSDEGIRHQEFCRVCKDGGDVILCDFCPCVYHLSCLNPPLKEAPDGDWKCPRCVMAEHPLKAKVKSILTWRWSHQLKGTDEFDHTHSPRKQLSRSSTEEKQVEIEVRPTRELFVRYEYHSYWDCEWIPELQLEVHNYARHHMFRKKFDLDEPPALEDGSSYGKMRHKQGRDKDPYNLEERFYRWGIKPDWLQIHRIIAHEGKGRDTKYLVKWCDLSYEDCTWEYPGEVDRAWEDEFTRHVDLYWDRRKEMIHGRKRKGEKPKKSMLKKKLEEQPTYVDQCGGQLHPYQIEGLNWLRFSFSQNTNTILADEMGLGKTVQAATFLYSLWREGFCNGPFLISAPLSTVPNWEREFNFWAPELYVVTYTGGKDARMVIRERDFCYKEGAFAHLHKPCKMKSDYQPKFDVLLTSYEFVNTDMTTLSSIHWDVIVIDEAHRLKNNQSLFFQTLSNYKVDYKLLLTGTPLQNNLEELFNLLNFLEPGKFNNVDEFLGEFNNISKDMQVARLHEMLAPHMLRRLKSDVLSDIPDKTELIVRIELAPMQKKFYKYILTKNYEALNVKGFGNQTSLKNIMMDLRKCCNHPYLFPAAENEAPLAKEGSYEGRALIKSCGKLVLLEKMLMKLKRDNHRVLIFSQMTKVLDILEEFLTYLEMKYERLDGSISSRVRQQSIDRFNDSRSQSFVFLLSTKAGGLGINLATADTVIIYDMDWNPHNDIQAFSRAHRIGQKNKVMIYRFVTRNTVEERMAKVCKQKMMLTELVIHKGLGAEKKDSLTKQEVSEILRHGAEELFKDEEEGKAVVYDDEAVEQLLNRDQKGEENAPVDKESSVLGMNEYLRSFKVASYQVKEGASDEEDEDDMKTATSSLEPSDNAEYWQKVLGPSYQEFAQQQSREAEAIARTLGKGKRIRRQVNYAEQQAMLELEARSKTTTVIEDATYLSDYEPSSSASDEEAAATGDKGFEDRKGRKRGKDRSHGSSKHPKEELPPLLAKVNGHVEVLGFTARQRRAFLDLVMKYGLPSEDVYNSPWRGRDLKDKSEKVLKAYTALFMRHLCEPISEDSEFFLDGIPREGLSQQHVLTRVGMIALIKKKVIEFEKVNGWHSMKEFSVAPNPVSAFRRGQLSKHMDFVEEAKKPGQLARMLVESDSKNGITGQPSKPDNTATSGDKSENVEKCTNDRNEKTSNESDHNDVKDEMKNESGEKMDVDDENAKSSHENGVDDKTDKTNSEQSGDGKMEVDDQSNEESSAHDKDDAGDGVKLEDDSDSRGVITNNDKSPGGNVNDEEDKGDASPIDKGGVDGDKKFKREAGEEGVKDEKDVGGMNDDHSRKDNGKGDGQDSDKDDETKGKGGCGKEKEDKDYSDEDKQCSDKDNSGDVKEAENEKDTGKVEKTKNGDSDTDKGKDVKEESDKEKQDKEASSKDDDASDTTKDNDASATNNSSKSAEKKYLKPKTPPKKKTYAEMVIEMRKIFWIADGGFTELHAFWQLEESNMELSKEYQTWHRRHDFWLLAGFLCLLENASDEARMKKAAFLNRRFQVLEQALVIEEQLRRAVERNPNAPEVKEALDNGDMLTAMDKMAVHLRNVNQAKDKSNVDKKSVKALNQVGSLVQDIKTNSYSTVPATMIAVPGAQPQVAGINKRSIVAPMKAQATSGRQVQKYVSTMLANKRNQQQQSHQLKEAAAATTTTKTTLQQMCNKTRSRSVLQDLSGLF